MNFPQVIVCEDDKVLLEMYRQCLSEYGFPEVICFEDSHDHIERIKACYVRPSVLVCDYCIHPVTPSRFLPELRAAMIEMPTVIVSGRIKAHQMNELIVTYPLRGFFEKGANAKATVNAIAKQLVDLGAEAIAAFETYQLHLEARSFIKRLDHRDCTAMLRLMSMEEVKVIASDLGFGINTVYALRKEMEQFVTGAELPERFRSLHSELTKRRALFA